MPEIQKKDTNEERLTLVEAAEYLLEECRMVLPGIQALFGFQLVAVFSEHFTDRLSPFEQDLHLLAIGLVALSVGLIMTPAAYHRQIGPLKVTRTFVDICTRLVLLSMLPLAIAICLDFYIVARSIIHDSFVPALTLLLFVVYIVLWFVLPRMQSLQRLIAGTSAEKNGAYKSGSDGLQ